MELQIWRGMGGAVLGLLLVIAFQVFLVKAARRRAMEKGTNRDVRFMDLIVTCEDESYSLSRLQMYCWTVVVVIGFAAVFMANYAIPDIPQNLYLLMGVNLAASVTATAIETIKHKTPGRAGRRTGKKPEFLRDIFFEAEDSLDLPRTQMFGWTIISLLAFAVMLVRSFSSTPALPDIPAGLVVLMGVSNGAYLGAKAVTRSEEARGDKKDAGQPAQSVAEAKERQDVKEAPPGDGSTPSQAN